MKFLVGSLLAVAAVAYESNDAAFLAFAGKHGKSFKSFDEYKMRLEQFKKTVRFIEDHNSLERTYTLGINEFSDWTDAEYDQLLGYKPSS